MVPRRPLDVIVVVIWAALAAILVLSGRSSTDIMAVFGLPLVLILPGYALTALLFRRGSLGTPEHIVFILGLSLACTIVGGVILNWTPFGLTTASWTVLLAGITLGSSAGALVRWRTDTQSVVERLRIDLSTRSVLLLILAVAIAAGAIAVSTIGEVRQRSSQGFVQLWILPAAGSSAGEHTIRVGMSNMETRRMTYRLVVQQDSKIVQVWPSITLEPHEDWVASQSIQLPVSPRLAHIPKGEAGTSIDAMLYRADAPSAIYRDVHLWLTP